VPESFRFSIIKPILKNKHGDQTNLDMYRKITLTPAISKLFEAVLLSIYSSFLNSDPQFYNKRGSKDYCVFTARRVCIARTMP